MAALTAAVTPAPVAIPFGTRADIGDGPARADRGRPAGRHEEQDIVYRSCSPTAPRARSRPPSTPDRGAPTDAAPGDADWRATLDTDPVRLFRFSALTYNGHRIHDDPALRSPGVEGYPGLVVHGPLLALLALELPRRHAPTEVVTEFAYRLVRPAFAGATIEATARRRGNELELAVGAQGSGRSLTATATLAPRSDPKMGT